MRTLHLFAGAGGGLLADLILGHTPIGAVDQDAYACDVLRRRAAEGWFTGLAVYECDVRTWDASEYTGRVDCIHAGFPCQDISVAGRGEGIAGPRTGLWSEVVRVADEVRPRQIFVENSPALCKRGLDQVLSDLAGLGFNVRWCVLPAAAVGAPHRRARWFGLAQIPYPDEIGCDGRSGKEQAEEQGRGAEPARRDWWAAEPNVGRMAHGMAHRVDRMSCLGNGQVPLQAAAAWMVLSGL